ETWRATAATTTRGTPLGSCELRRLRRIPRRGRPCSDRVPFLGRPAIRRSRPLPVAGRDRQPPRLLDPDSRRTSSPPRRTRHVARRGRPRRASVRHPALLSIAFVRLRATRPETIRLAVDLVV